MGMRIPLLLSAALGFAALTADVDARPRSREQDAALKALQEGRIKPLHSIESMIFPQMRGYDYLGPELDAASARYRLKFMRNGQVIWIDVDARTGQIISRSGH